MRLASGLLLAALAWLAAGGAHAIDKDTAFDDPELNARYIALIREIRCPLCLNESIADSSAPIAADLRREVRRLMSEGATNEEIRDFLSERYGDFVLYRPRVNPVTYALWVGPFIFLLVGGFAFWRVARARNAEPIEDDEDLPA
jgi:cytochrome c-type biogenesis protein CcmH